jgi:hypothetical protein
MITERSHQTSHTLDMFHKQEGYEQTEHGEYAFGNGWHVSFNPEGFLTVKNRDGDTVLRDASAAVTFTDGKMISCTDQRLQRTVLVTETGLSLHAADEENDLRLVWDFFTEIEAPELTMRLTLRSREERQLRHMELLRLPEGFSGEKPQHLMIDNPGWSSWSPDRYRSMPEMFFLPQGMVDPVIPPLDRNGIPMSGAAHFTSDSGESVFFGFTSCFTQDGIIEITRAEEGHTITVWNDRQNVPEEQNGHVGTYTYASETLFVSFNRDRHAAKQAWAKRVAATHGVVKEPTDFPGIGINEWYLKKQEVTYRDTEENFAVIEAMPNEYPFTRVERDDGWFTGKNIGDWTLGEQDTELPGLIERVHESGRNALIWMAPLIVNSQSHAAQVIEVDHPEWLIRDERGNRRNIFENENWAGENYALDIRQEAVQDYVVSQISAVIDTLGLQQGDILKTDFLCAAMSWTGAYASRQTFEKIAQVVDEKEIRLLLCGAPFLYLVGIGAHTPLMRTAPDTEQYWLQKDRWNQSQPSVNNNTQWNLERAHYMQEWFHIDADNLVISKGTNFHLTPDEDAFNIAASALTGMQILSVDLRGEDPQRDHLISKLLPFFGEAAKPIDEAEEFYHLTTNDSIILGLFNRSEAEKTVPDDLLARVGSVGKAYLVYDLMSEEFLGQGTETLPVETISPHGVKLLSLREVQYDDEGRQIPQVIATDHIFGGAVEIKGEAWNADQNELTVHLQYPEAFLGKNIRNIAVYIPEAYRQDDAEVMTLSAQVSGEDEAIVTVNF